MVNEPHWLTGERVADYPRSVRRSHSSTSHTEASAVHDLVIDNARIIDGLAISPAREAWPWPAAASPPWAGTWAPPDSG
jgi:hypothetical protein